MATYICCKKVQVAVHQNSCQIRGTFLRTNWKKTFHQNPFAFLYSLLVIFLLYVLYITNQKHDFYKHENHIYNEGNIHDSHNSKFHYAVVIDCGSSGSRVYIYYWPPHTGDKQELLNIKQMLDFDGNPVRMKIKPGISSYADNPSNASHSLKPLLLFAMDHIPHNKYLETPLYILATAGMRLLPESKREAILENLRENIPTMSHFHFVESQLEVISGKQEGIYLWIATNYILGRFDHSHDVSTTPSSTVSHLIRKQTMGTIEIGGASLQIAYEISQNASIPPELGSTINLGCDIHDTVHRYQIYVTTFLGYGTDSAWKTYVQKLFEDNVNTIRAHETVLDPCLPKELVDEQIVNNTKFKITGTGEFSRCKNLLASNIEQSSAVCKKSPCSLDGVYQTPIDYQHVEFYGFAEFWYSSNDVLNVGGKYSYDSLQNAAQRFCDTRWSLHKRHYAMGLYPKADDSRFRYQCFKSAWVLSVLHHGLKFPHDFNGLTTAQMIDGKEVQWTLGAILYRTRFMPLRDMQNMESIHSTKALHSGIWIVFYSGFYPILFICASIAIIFIIIYCRRIRKYSRLPDMYSMQHPILSNYTVLSNKEKAVYDIRVEL
ncbi:ectonucleoside triphosphate diphosphohydrolase 7 [Hydra vulgaris]|nr:ectonucleoside triphosphate diphosphohydrolase 7 [Hydra vulgaris]